MKRLTPNKYQDFKKRIGDLDEKVEEARPKDKYMLIYRCSQSYIEWSITKFMTLEEAEQQRDYLTDNGRVRNLEIYITEILTY